jgi:carboxypeptidase family protein/TonB-dependent receptor-like protein
MMRARFASFATLLIGLLLLLPVQSFGQAVFGSIFGTVTDASGAVIPNAKVTVTDIRKGTSVTYVTNESGNYSATHLIPDIYTIKIEATGFTTAQSDNLQVSADTGSKFDAALKTGTQTETVQVTAEAPQLKTDREDVAIEFNQKYVEDLPIFNRNFTSFELLSPGTQKLVGWSHAATENPQGGQQIFVNGQHFSGTAFELDGTDNQDPILGIIVVNPNLDAVSETKIATQNYDAEFGKAVAGVVTAQTKSGSNDLHGSAFWFRRTDATEARDPFTQSTPDKITGRLIPSSRWNQFGGSVGGPVIKDKLFFFGDYQGTRQVNGQSNSLTIPTAQVLSSCLAATGLCDLSQYQPFIGNGKAGDPTNYIYDPTTGNQTTGAGRLAFCGATDVANPTSANCATPFMIPVGKLSPQALNILKLFPAPSNGNITNNFVGAGSGPFNQNSFDTRVDYNVSSSIQAFGRFSLDYFNLSGQGALGPLGGIGFGLGGLDGESTIHNYSLASGVTKTFSPTLLGDFRFGYFKYNPQANKLDAGTAPATAFGIPGLNTNAATSGLPYFNMTVNNGTLSDFGDGLGVGRCNCPLTESEQQFQWVGNITKIVGNHQFKFGADIRFAENLRVPSDSNRAGQLQFNSLGTSGGTNAAGVGAGQGGFDLATLLLGNVSQFDRFVSSSLNAAERQKRWFFYGQDTWRATSKLTINYGLRWEDYFPETVNAKGNGGFANIQQGEIRVAGFGPYGLNGNIGNATGAFAPRLGLAYQIKQNTVIRMGYGRSYDMGVFGSNFGHTVTQNLPVLVDQQIQSNNVTGNPATPSSVVPVFLLSQGPPAFQFPTIPASGLLPLTGFDGTGNPHIRPVTQRLPTLDAWNLTVQRQLNSTTSVDVAYIGNKGTHVFAGTGPSYNVNQPSIVGFSQGVSQAARRPLFNAFVYNGIPGYVDPTTGKPLLCCSGDLGNYAGNDASSNYNALQVKVDKRFSHGLQVLSHYTFSHANNFDSNYYVDDPRIAYGPDDDSRNQVWVTSIVYELPFGRGKMFGSGVGKAGDYLIGGWQINTTTNWSSGLPFTPSTGECNSEQDVGVCRPNAGSGSFALGGNSFNPVTHSVQFFTPVALGGAFTDPGVGNLGNAGRNILHGPRYFGTDMSLMKNFPISERVKGQFRMDAFNVFNHPVLGFSSTQGNLCVDCVGTNAGQVTDIESDTQMRQLQFAVRFNF